MAAKDETPDPAPVSPEAILAERKRAAEYNLDRYLQDEAPRVDFSLETVLDW